MYNSAATSRLVNPLATKATTSRSRSVRSSGERDPCGAVVIPAPARSASTRRRNGSAPTGCQQVVGGVQLVQSGTPPSLGQQDPTQGVVQAGPIEEGVVAAE